jgi:hypothetical protein
VKGTDLIGSLVEPPKVVVIMRNKIIRKQKSLIFVYFGERPRDIKY